MQQDIEEILFSREDIDKRVAQMGAQIQADYAGKDLLLLGILKGAVLFISDLSRAIDLPLEVDYLAVSSYGNNVTSSGVVRILKDLEGPISNKHVLIVEDIVDSGRTIHYLMEVLRQRSPLSLRVCTLLDKPAERVRPVVCDYVGFQCPSRFVVGYGLDYAQRYRNLSFVGILKRSIYAKDEPEPEQQHTSPAEEHS